jgi:DNA-directed RNA polymerase sigma subunit (sigma70/sigma32)
MEYIEKIKKMLCKELDEYAMKTKLSMADIDVIHKLTDTVKNLDKIEMLEEDGGYSEARGRGRSYMHGSSYDDDMMYSERRGRGRNARRDSMGRYSSDMDDYSEARMDRRYSRDDAKDHMMNKLGEMMTSADEEQRQILKDAMRKIERA